MRFFYNTLVLLLATTVFAAPIPTTSDDALTDSASTGEHAPMHHRHLHHFKHAKHAKHIAHPDESELAARSLFDELEERSFYDEEYSQLERRGGQDKGKGKARPNLKIVTSAVSKFIKGKDKAPPSSSSSGHSIDHARMAGQHVNPNHGSPTPFTGHQAAPSHHAGPSNQGAISKAAQASMNKPLPPLPHSPHRSNSLPASAGSQHHDAPPPYSMHVANPGSPSSPSSPVRRPQRSMSTDSGLSRLALHGSTDRFSIDSPRSDISVAGSSPRSSKRDIQNV